MKPFCRYVPFGAVDEVMVSPAGRSPSLSPIPDVRHPPCLVPAPMQPYLIRRAQENSDMLGGVSKEVAMLRAELARRLRS